MAIWDGAIEGIDSMSAVSQIKAAAFDQQGMLRLKIRPSKAELLVFRKIEWRGDLQAFVKDNVIRQAAAHFLYQLQHVGKEVSLLGICLKDIRRMAANYLNHPQLPKRSAQVAIGHCPGTNPQRSDLPVLERSNPV